MRGPGLSGWISISCMASRTRVDFSPAAGACHWLPTPLIPVSTLAKSFEKILVCITEDWFALSHFQPLLRTLVDIAGEVVVATRSSGRMAEIEALGCRAIELDWHRSQLAPATQAGVVRQLVGLIADEKPTVVHAIAMQTLIVTGIALHFAPRVPHVVLHLTGLGFVGISRSRAAGLVRPVALRILAGTLRRPDSWLLAENPEDVEFLRAGGADAGARLTLLGGAGIDETQFPRLPQPINPVPVAAFVGRMIRPKGVHVLVEAQRRLAQRGVGLELALYGNTDDGNTEGVPRAEIEGWTRGGVGGGGVSWHGHVADVRQVWARADIAVLPAIAREGMPRAVLEAASSGRPLIVTDVPGCRHFVRDGVEGLVVSPADPDALADALARLAGDAGLRARMGTAARERVLSGYTIDHVTAGVRAAYAALIGRS